MRKDRRSRRHMRGRFDWLLRIVGALVMVGALFGGAAMFFRTEQIIVSGNVYYSAEQIIEASGLQIGDNMFLMDKYRRAEMIFDRFPYIEKATINRQLPSTLLITVEECTAAAAIVVEDGYWYISADGKVLEHKEEAADCTVVHGMETTEYRVGEQLHPIEDDAVEAEALLAVLQGAKARGILSDISDIYLNDESCMTFSYQGRFTVKLPWLSDKEYKLDSVVAVAEYLALNLEGTINLMREDGTASFIPAVE